MEAGHAVSPRFSPGIRELYGDNPEHARLALELGAEGSLLQARYRSGGWKPSPALSGLPFLVYMRNAYRREASVIQEDTHTWQFGGLTCLMCDAPHYAAGFCRRCYWAEYGL